MTLTKLVGYLTQVYAYKIIIPVPWSDIDGQKEAQLDPIKGSRDKVAQARGGFVEAAAARRSPRRSFIRARG